MKWRICLYIFSINVFLFGVVIIQVFANSIYSSPIEDPIIRSVYMFFISILSTIIEYNVFKYNIGKNQFRNKGLFKSCFKVDLVTFPLVYLLSYIIFLYLNLYFLFFFILIGLAVFPVEYLLLKREFTRKFEERYPSDKFFLNFIITNFISFFIGFLAFIPIFPTMGIIA